MADTVIVDALRGIVEDGTVDPQDFKDWLCRIETALIKQGDLQMKHAVDMARIEAKANSAHKRLDEAVAHLKGPGKAGWASIIIALITAGGAVAIAWLKGSQ